jgi:hypothetical protein
MLGKWGFLPLLAALGLSGCATIPTEPSVMVLPGRGSTLEQFQTDDGVCKQWATQRAVATSGAASTPAVGSSPTGGVLVEAGPGTPGGGASGASGGGAAMGTGPGLAEEMAVGLAASRAAVGSGQWRYDVSYEQCMYVKGHQIPVVMRPTRRSDGTPPPPPAGVPAPPPPPQP